MRIAATPSEEMDLSVIPGIGRSLSKKLNKVGIRSVSDLKDNDPEMLYRKLCKIEGPTDPCVLYAFRCAVYFASHKKHKPSLLLWWNWRNLS